MSRLCILTPDTGYGELTTAERAHYVRLFGDDLAFRNWRDAGDLSGFALVMPLLAWGYHLDPARWYGLLDQWEAAALPFANPVAVLRWNTDKDYLIDLAERGVAVVPTRESHDLCANDLAEARAAFGCDTLVVKPSISGGADRTYRLGRADPVPFDALGREMLIQPLMPAIESEGEYSLFVFAGEYSHAIIKRPAAGDFRVQTQFGGREESIDPPDAALDCAAAALAACPGDPLYARIDLLRDGERFVVMELELIEPALFLDHAEDGGAAFAEAVVARLG